MDREKAIWGDWGNKFGPSSIFLRGKKPSPGGGPRVVKDTNGKAKP